jgi:hypothetical protein
MQYPYAKSRLVRNNDQTSYAVLRNIARGCAKSIQIAFGAELCGGFVRTEVGALIDKTTPSGRLDGMQSRQR